jgi:hypothetical protein
LGAKRYDCLLDPAYARIIVPEASLLSTPLRHVFAREMTMKRLALGAALLLSSITPFATANAAPVAPVAEVAKQSYVEYLGSFSLGGEVYDVFAVYDLGGGYY